MILGASAGTTAQYIVGGLMHLVIGVSYAVIFAVLFAPVSAWSTVTKGAVFGIAVTALALAMMPVMAAVMGGDAAANPCGPPVGHRLHRSSALARGRWSACTASSPGSVRPGSFRAAFRRVVSGFHQVAQSIEEDEEEGEQEQELGQVLPDLFGHDLDVAPIQVPPDPIDVERIEED